MPMDEGAVMKKCRHTEERQYRQMPGLKVGWQDKNMDALLLVWALL